LNINELVNYFSLYQEITASYSVVYVYYRCPSYRVIYVIPRYYRLIKLSMSYQDTNELVNYFSLYQEITASYSVVYVYYRCSSYSLIPITMIAPIVIIDVCSVSVYITAVNPPRKVKNRTTIIHSKGQ
jgi:hypothetical protein